MITISKRISIINMIKPVYKLVNSIWLLFARAKVVWWYWFAVWCVMYCCTNSPLIDGLHIIGSSYKNHLCRVIWNRNCQLLRTWNDVSLFHVWYLVCIYVSHFFGKYLMYMRFWWYDWFDKCEWKWCVIHVLSNLVYDYLCLILIFVII